MDHIKILVNGTNQEIKRKYFKLQDSQNVGYFDLSTKEIRMVNLEDGFALKNNTLVTSPPILKIRGTIIDVRMDTDSNLILIDSVEVSTSTAYTTVFEPYKNTDYLVYIDSYVIDFQNKMKNMVLPKPILKKNTGRGGTSTVNQRFTGKENFSDSGLPKPWIPIQNGNTLNLIDIAFDGGSDSSATHNLYAMDASHKFYELNIKLDGSVNAPITGNTIWSELLEINTDLAAFYAKGFGPQGSVGSPMLSAYCGALILTFYSSGGFTQPICISLNRDIVPDWMSNFPLASTDPHLIIQGVVWPKYVRSPSSTNSFWGNVYLTPNNNLPAGGKIGGADIVLSDGHNISPSKCFFTLAPSGPSNSPATHTPVIGITSNNEFGLNFLKNTSKDKGWGFINNVFTDSTDFIIDSQSTQYQTNGIILIDWQDTQIRHIDYWKIDDASTISNMGTIQIPMGLGVLQFAAFNGIMFCLTTTGLYFMRYTDTLDGTTPLIASRCCETGVCGSGGTLLTNQLNLWTDCSSTQICNYTGKNTCTGPPPGPKPTPSPSPSPSNGGGFFTRIWGWIKDHWIISLTTVAVLILIFILIIFIAVKSKQSSSLSGQFNQNLEVLEQQKLASLLQTK